MKFFKIIFIILSLLFVSAFAIAFYLNMPSGQGKAVEFEIKSGESPKNISKRLEKEKLIQNQHLAYLYTRSKMYMGKRIHKGKYKFQDNLSTIEIINLFIEGKAVPDQVKLTIPEGKNVYDIADILKEQGIIKEKSEFLKLVRNQDLINEYGIEAKSLEGYLYPTTYFILKDEKVENIVRRMLNTFVKNFPKDEFHEVKDKLKLNRHDIMILASLIEKETGVSSERRIVSSVYHNRIKKGMKMECDPTVIYALLLANRYRGKLSRARGDLDIDSRYNTYLYKGLPPGPIANPSRASILAALDPEDTDYIYFVAKSDKSHNFSTNFADHNRYVEEYRKFIREQRRQQRQQN